jgi:predicted nucleic acid-binding Zn ribbon protein
MEPAGRLFGRMKLPRDVVTLEDIARKAWGLAVGKRIAARTQPVALVRGKLVVEVEDIVWQRQLNTLSGQILANLRKHIGPEIVDDLDFRPMGARRPVQRAQELSPAKPRDEAASIADPVLRRLYIVSRNKASA